MLPPATAPPEDPSEQPPDQPADQPTFEGMEVPPARPSSTPSLLQRLRADRRYPAFKRYALPVLMVLIIGVIALNDHFGGVDWGDDFALYMHQAKGLAIGNVGEVLAQNRFTVDNSGWHTFSPYSYPWGWPLIVAPFYAIKGLDYSTFKFLEVVAFCVFLLTFFALVRRRTGPLAAGVLTLVIGLSPAYVGATDSVLSDLPFLCFVGLSLWWMERCRIRGILTTRTRDLVVLGLLLAFTLNIRREGVALIPALVALHLTVLVPIVRRARSVRVLTKDLWQRVAIPYASLVGAVIVFQLVLPTVLFPDAPGTGWVNASKHLTYYRDSMAEQLGLKQSGSALELFHSATLAKDVLGIVVILAILGLACRLLWRFEADVTLAVYLLAAGFIMLISPYQEPRYLITITPFVVYFAYQALPTVARLLDPRRKQVLAGASIVSVVFLAWFALLNARHLAHAVNYHRTYHYTVNGPESPAAQEMLQAVRDGTRGDDVILFFRARAMTLYTDRLAVQGSNLDLMLKRVDWYVMAKNSTYSQTLLTDQDAAARGLTKAWENSGWVIWRVPRKD